MPRSLLGSPLRVGRTHPLPLPGAGRRYFGRTANAQPRVDPAGSTGKGSSSRSRWRSDSVTVAQDSARTRRRGPWCSAASSAVGVRSDCRSSRSSTAFVGALAVVVTGHRRSGGRQGGGSGLGPRPPRVRCTPTLGLRTRVDLAEPLAIAGGATVIWLTYRFRARPAWAGAVASGPLAGGNVDSLGLIAVAPASDSSRCPVILGRLGRCLVNGAHLARLVGGITRARPVNHRAVVPSTTGRGSRHPSLCRPVSATRTPGGELPRRPTAATTSSGGSDCLDTVAAGAWSAPSSTAGRTPIPRCPATSARVPRPSTFMLRQQGEGPWWSWPRTSAARSTSVARSSRCELES